MAFPFIYRKRIKISKSTLSLEEAKDVVIDYLETKRCNGDITDNAIYFRDLPIMFSRVIGEKTTGEIFFDETDNYITIKIRTKNYLALGFFIVLGFVFPIFIAFPKFGDGWQAFTIVWMLMMFFFCGINYYPTSLMFAYGIKRRLKKFKKIVT
jgi:hypothetical protein